MRTLYFDSHTGAAGDMILGALLDAGASETALRAQLAAINLGDYQLVINKTQKNGITATKLTVVTPDTHQHCHLPKILKMLEDSQLSSPVKVKCQAIFENLAQAEAKIHGIAAEKVHFHEVGAVDSLVDIIGSVIALELLGIEKIYCSPLPLGSGYVQCAHGTIPVPAPATLELLKGVPLKETSLPGELVTPTGAAILTTLAEAWVAFPAMIVRTIGYGAGTRDLAVPNVLRVVIGDELGDIPSSTEFLNALAREELFLVETNIDDLNPEFYPHLVSLLLDKGALDAYWQPILMKKGRAGCLLSALVPPANLEVICATLFSETSTLGFRVSSVDRYKLPRSFQQVDTPYGAISVKLGHHPQTGLPLNTAPEYEDCRLAAITHQVPLKNVYEAAMQAALRMRALK